MRLVITEKKKQCEDLASAMGWKQDSGCYKGSFENDEVIATWARGHLVTLKSPSEVVDGLGWDTIELLSPIPRTYPLKPLDDMKGVNASAQPRTYLKRISGFIKKANEVILATDSDREGEAVGWYILNHLKFKGPVRRAWFSSGLDKKSLTQAMANLRPSAQTKPWFYAAEARGRSDLAYIFLVIAYTFYAKRNKYGTTLSQGRGRSGVVSVGRVQTPTLRMVVDREKEISNFVSIDYYKISCNFSLDNNDVHLTGDYKPKVTASIIEAEPKGVTWQPSKVIPKEGEPDPLDVPYFTGKKEVTDFESRLLQNKDKASVFSYKEGDRNENPPKTFSLTDAQTAIARQAKISANLVQVILEDLYEQGWTSYARTSKSDLPINFYDPSELKSLISSVSGLTELKQQATEVLSIHSGNHSTIKKFTPSVFTKKDLEHHGIVPTHKVMTESALNSLSPSKKSKSNKVEHTKEQMKIAYLAIVKQFIQALYPAAKYKTQKIEFKVPAEDMLGNSESYFSAKGERIVDLGWRNAFKTDNKKEKIYPALKPGYPAVVDKVVLNTSKTTPPPRYTEITLPKEMEKVGKLIRDPKLRKLLKNAEGIGTPATRKNVIETLIAREYVDIKKGTYYPTKKAFEIISIVPEWLSSVETTAVWEDFLSQICDTKDLEQAVGMRDQFTEKQTDKIEDLINSMISEFGTDVGPAVGPAPQKVSPKMKAAIRRICESKGIKPEPGTYSDPVKAKVFLDEHLSNSTEPSESQINLLKNLVSKNNSITIPDNAYTDKKVCGEYIDKFLNANPPSAKQLSFAKSIRDKNPQAKKAWTNNIETSGVACRKFLDKFAKKKSSVKKKSYKR